MNNESSVFNGFQVKTKLGSGRYASVLRAYDKIRNKDVAIKCLDKIEISKARADSIIREIEILKVIEHQNIVQMLDYLWDDRYVYIILEYCNGGDLSKYIKENHKLSEIICKDFMIQLIGGLECLHSRGIYHYDLKPHNILIQNQISTLILKISDFGLSLYSKTLEELQGTSLGPRGTPSYMAPEILSQDNYDPTLIDLWSLGVIFYECLHGTLPLPQTNIKELMLAVKKKTPIKFKKAFSPECMDLLRKLLNYNPEERITIKKVLEHPFVATKTSQTTQKLEKANGGVRTVTSQTNNVSNVSFNCETSKLVAPSTTVEVSEAPSSACVNQLTDEEENLLKSLSRSTPKMYDGLDVGYSAQMYLHEGNLQEALNKFLIALSLLIPVLREEPNGQRKTLFTIQIKKWLQQAENIKKFLKINQDFGNLDILNTTKDSV